MSERIYFGRLDATVSQLVDAVDLLPHYELAARPVPPFLPEDSAVNLFYRRFPRCQILLS